MLGKGKRPLARNPRAQFDFLFGYDPSTSQDDLTGNVPQALFMMNSRLINSLIHGKAKPTCATSWKNIRRTRTPVREVYVLTWPANLRKEE